jgi:tRNA A22 N-methylase
MTHPEILAKYLVQQGFEITDEKIVRDGGRDDRIYRILSAKFDGKSRKLTEGEALIGRINIDRCDEITAAYIKKNIRILETRIVGKAGAGADAEREKLIVSELNSFLERKN